MKQKRSFKSKTKNKIHTQNEYCTSSENPLTLKQLEQELSLSHLYQNEISEDADIWMIDKMDWMPSDSLVA